MSDKNQESEPEENDFGDERVEPSKDERLNPEQVEENLVFGYGSKGGDMDLVKLIDNFLGSDKQDFSGKTVLNYQQVHLLTRLGLIPELYQDELEDNHKRAIEGFIHGYEKRLTSLGGRSRNDITDMVSSMINRQERDGEKNMLNQLFGENESNES